MINCLIHFGRQTLNPDEIFIITGDRDGGDTYSYGLMKSNDGGNTFCNGDGAVDC